MCALTRQTLARKRVSASRIVFALLRLATAGRAAKSLLTPQDQSDVLTKAMDKAWQAYTVAPAALRGDAALAKTALAKSYKVRRARRNRTHLSTVAALRQTLSLSSSYM